MWSTLCRAMWTLSRSPNPFLLAKQLKIIGVGQTFPHLLAENIWPNSLELLWEHFVRPNKRGKGVLYRRIEKDLSRNDKNCYLSRQNLNKIWKWPFSCTVDRTHSMHFSSQHGWPLDIPWCVALSWLGRHIAKTFSTFSLWGSLFLMPSDYTQSQKKRNFSSWIFPGAQGQGHVYH